MTNDRIPNPKNVKPGDTLILGGPGASMSAPLGYPEGDQVVVTHVRPSTLYGASVMFEHSGDGVQSAGYAIARFSLPEPASQLEIDPGFFDTPTRVVVVPDDVSVYDIPRRSYDFSLGDRRFGDWETAVEWAQQQDERYLVRRDPADTPGVKLYLAQRLGS